MGFLSTLGNAVGIAGGIKDLFGGGSDEQEGLTWEERAVLRKWTNEDWLWQTENRDAAENWRYERNRQDAQEDAYFQFTNLRDAAQRGGFNPLSVLGISQPMAAPSGGVGGAGVSAAPMLTTPQALSRSPNVFEGVSNILHDIDEMLEKEQDIKTEELEQENERLRGGRPQHEPMQETANTNSGVPVSFRLGDTGDNTRFRFPDLSNPETFELRDGKVTTPSEAVFDNDGMPLELETEAFGSAERGNIVPWAIDLFHRNTLSTDGYEVRRRSLQDHGTWWERRGNRMMNEMWDSIGTDTTRRQRRETRSDDYDKRIEEIKQRRGNNRFFYPSM